MTNITAVKGRVDFSTNREMLDFAEGIALLDANENPFTLATMKFKTKTSGNIKHSWLKKELIPETDMIDIVGLSTLTANTTLRPENEDRFALGDIWRREASGETFLVTGTDGTDLTIVRDYGNGASDGAYDTLADTFADEDIVVWVGNAFEDGASLPGMRSLKETQMDNFCQLQRTPWGLGELAAAASVRGEDDWTLEARVSAITHMRKIERQNLFGHPAKGDLTINSGAGTAPSAGGGMWHFLKGGDNFSGTGSDRLVSNAEITHNEFLEYLEALFEFGSSRRVCFCLPKLRTALDYWGISKLNTFSETTKYGMKIATWLSSHGEIAFITHKMLKDQGGSDGGYAFFMDMDDITWVIYNGFATHRRDLEPYKSGGKMVKEAEWVTCGCLEVKEPRKHGCIYNITSFAA